jgi:hypothetical protein
MPRRWRNAVSGVAVAIEEEHAVSAAIAAVAGDLSPADSDPAADSVRFRMAEETGLVVSMVGERLVNQFVPNQTARSISRLDRIDPLDPMAVRREHSHRATSTAALSRSGRSIAGLMTLTASGQ